MILRLDAYSAVQVAEKCCL